MPCPRRLLGRRAAICDGGMRSPHPVSTMATTHRPTHFDDLARWPHAVAARSPAPRALSPRRAAARHVTLRVGSVDYIITTTSIRKSRPGRCCSHDSDVRDLVLLMQMVRLMVIVVSQRVVLASLTFCWPRDVEAASAVLLPFHAP